MTYLYKNISSSVNSIVIILIILVIVGFFFRKEIKARFFPDKEKNFTVDDRYNSEKREREKEIDQLLNKIGKNGLNDLSEKDKRRLDELSKK